METVRKAVHKLPHSLLGEVVCSVYERGEEQAIAMVYGRLQPRSRTLVRIQSSCIYGDVLLASDCDCRTQIDESFHRFFDAGAGVLLYLDQEGRGAGLIAKAKSYELMEQQGLDTVEAYEQMGLPVDSRDYSLAIDILEHLNLWNIELLTNNPRKIEAFSQAGIDVAHERLSSPVNKSSLAYLRVKQAKLGHMLELPPPQPNEGGPDGPPAKCWVIGAAVMDHVFHVPKSPRIGRTRQAKSYERRPGGKGFNQAIALSRLGADVSLLTVKGHDADAEVISSVLAMENVAARFVGTPNGSRSPQTAVVQPDASAPTYVGWLAGEHRSLRKQAIAEWASEIASSDAVMFTLESSVGTISRTLEHISPRTLAILNASPALEEPYRIDTALLERVDVLIGSHNELRALLLRGTKSLPETADMPAYKELATLCGLTVIATDLRSPVRRVTGVNPYLEKPVTVSSPQVRLTESPKVSAAVGNQDVFCAAFALEALKLLGEDTHLEARGPWRTRNSVFAKDNNLLDILMSAVIPEAWVVRSSDGGFTTFPRLDAEFEKWSREHPPLVGGSSGSGKTAGKGS